MSEQARALLIDLWHHAQRDDIKTREDWLTVCAPLIAAALREATAKGLEEAADYLENHLDFGVSGYEFRQEALSWCRTQAQARKERP